MPFIISDAPVAVQEVTSSKEKKIEASGENERFIKIKNKSVPGAKRTQTFFPLTPNHALLILSYQSFPEAKPNRGKTLSIKSDSVKQFNSAQILNSKRWLYSSINFKNIGLDKISSPRKFKLPK